VSDLLHGPNPAGTGSPARLLAARPVRHAARETLQLIGIRAVFAFEIAVTGGVELRAAGAAFDLDDVGACAGDGRASAEPGPARELARRQGISGAPAKVLGHSLESGRLGSGLFGVTAAADRVEDAGEHLQ
jgi:hypothetical protein